MSDVLNENDRKDLLSRYIETPHLFGSEILGYDKLTEIHSQWIRYVWYSKGDVTLQAHRYSYKTTSVVICGIILWLLFNSNTTILLLRKTFDASSEVMEAIQNHYTTNTKLQYFYSHVLGVDNIVGNVWNSKRMSLSTKTNITVEPNLRVKGMNDRGKTGAHFDIILCDDIINDDDRFYYTERERTKRRLRELMNIAPAAAGKRKIYMGTPWHEDDGFTLVPTPAKYPIGTIEINGFDPTSDELKNMRENSPALYACNYELEHILESGLFSKIKFIKQWDTTQDIRAVVDPAWSGKHTTGFVIGYYDREYKRFVLRIFAFREHIDKAIPFIIQYAKAANCGTIYVEENKDEGAVRRAIGEYWATAVGYKVSRNKHERIINYVSLNWGKTYVLEPETEFEKDAVNIFKNYEEGIEPDDPVDAAAKLFEVFAQDLEGTKEMLTSMEMALKYNE